MTDQLAGHFDALKKEIRLLRRQLKTTPQPVDTTPKIVISWTTALSQYTTLIEELKDDITALKTHIPLPTRPHMIIDDIEHIILRNVQSLIPQPNAPADTNLTDPDLATTIVEAHTTHIATGTSSTINAFKIAHTNELALHKISAASAALTRIVKLNKIEDDHTKLLDQHAFLAK